MVNERQWRRFQCSLLAWRFALCHVWRKLELARTYLVGDYFPPHRVSSTILPILRFKLQDVNLAFFLSRGASELISSLSFFSYSECPTGSGDEMNLANVAEDIQHRIINLFARDNEGNRACNGGSELLNKDPFFRDFVPFHGESFILYLGLSLLPMNVSV